MYEDWIQLFTLIVTNFTIVWWFRKESREDWARNSDKMDKMVERTDKILEAIQSEMKDFHERLLKIEMGRDVWKG